MIAMLHGRVAHVDFSEVVIDVNGVGYGVNLPIQDVATLQIGEDVSVFVVEIVREQSYDLYGFLELQAKKLFMLLVKINSVGPRTALALIGLGSVEQLAAAAQSEDWKYFAAAPGVGQKLASRLCLELKGKIDHMVSADGHARSRHSQGVDLDVAAALAALGFKQADISRMIQSIDSSQSIEEQIKAALKER